MNNNKKVLVEYKRSSKKSRTVSFGNTHHEHTIRRIQRDE